MFDNKSFANPLKEYSPVPFWFWNDEMKDEEIVYELKEMASKSIYEAIIHARKGLAFEYLSEEWFHKIGVALKMAEKLGMRLWIYDEDDWPSGYAGGRVLKRDPSFASKCLSVEKIYPVLGKPVYIPNKPNSDLVAVVAVFQDKEFIDITDCGRNGKEPWHSTTLCWEVFVFRMENCLHTPAYTDTPYVDLLNEKATEAFIEVTHKEYKKRFPQYWGNVIKGFFTDEPGFYQNYLEQAKNLNTIAWSKLFPERFKKAYGYDIRPYLPTLWQDMELSKKIRADYYEALDRFYKESYFDKITDFLHEDGLLLIGHLHHEEKLSWLVQTEGDFFSIIDGLDYAGTDCIDKSLPRITEKLCSSAADLLKKPRALSETFGGFGWELTPKEMKRYLDLQFAQGINMVVLHAFFSSIEGFRKMESPPSLFYQNDYWPHFDTISRYITRLSYALSQGEHRPKVALYYPAIAAEKLFTPLSHREVCDIDDCLDRLTGFLLSSGIDYELVPESFLSKAKVDHGRLIYEDFSFEALILPSSPDQSVLPIIKEFSKEGRIYSLGKKKDDNFVSEFHFYFDEANLIKSLDKQIDKGFDGENVISYVRQGTGWKLRFLVNKTDETNFISLHVQEGEVVEEANAETGEIFTLITKGQQRSEKVSFSPNEAKLFLFRTDYPAASSPFKEATNGKKVPLLLEEASFNGEKYPFVSAHKNNLHQFDGEIVLKYTFELSDNFKATALHFGDIRDYATVYINGKEAGTRLYPPFRFDIASFAKTGRNEITLSIHNVKANAFEGKDLDAGLFGEAFVEVTESD